MDSDHLDHVLDKLSEGLFDQSLQGQALTSLADYCSGTVAGVSIVCQETGLCSSVFSSPIGRKIEDEQSSAVGPALVQLTAAAKETSLKGQLRDVILASEQGSDPAMKDFLNSAGMVHLMGSAVLKSGSKTIFLFLLNDGARGHFTVQDIERFNHVRIASHGVFRMMHQLDNKLANYAIKVISPIFAAVIVNEKGQHVSHNERFQELLDDGVVRTKADDCIEFGDTNSETLMIQLRSGKIAQTNHVPLLFVRGTDYFKIRLLDLPKAGFEAQGGCAAIVLSPVFREPKLNIELARKVYNFTPSEAEIAAELIAGRSTKLIAEARGVAPSTVKSLVRGVLRKTESARQIEAVARLNMLPQNFSTLEV